MEMIKKYFLSSFFWTLMGILGGYWLGGWNGAFVVAILTLLEVSISFDNAVVNATVLKDMTPLWRHRFLTWGMLIAVFGMRLVFPLLIVALVGHLNPWAALQLAALEPQKYADLMLSVHHEISAFGGAFLLLVSLKYFFDQNKDVHWIQWIEKPLVKLGRLEAVEIGVVLLVLIGLCKAVAPEVALEVLLAGLAGVLTFLAVEAVGEFLKAPDSDSAAGRSSADLHRASLGMFLYLEVLDASFSFDGVIGAFAITNNLFIIAIGLGVGALYVRSLTLMMVDRGALEAYRFLEHGAFYAVASLAGLMFTSLLVPVPEWITGIFGAGFIVLSVISSRLQAKH